MDPTRTGSGVAVHPLASSEGVRLRMQRQRRRDTEPELALRRILHAAGLRYRVDYPPLPGLRRKADVVFTKAKVAVFIDGCFWHRCPTHGTVPKANGEWWAAKLDRNVERDRETDHRMSTEGWLVMRYWEHDDPRSAAEAIVSAVAVRRLQRASAARAES